jgi:hypothetical protein
LLIASLALAPVAGADNPYLLVAPRKAHGQNALLRPAQQKVALFQITVFGVKEDDTLGI